ncbi:indolepyruvate oxidoreductase subunit beta [Alistipes shahii]|uniref:indolepyruvate oxidoreductase subunit beta n=1 Tax=Alistipes shahii TaxID=328814 RepID=UPI003AF5BD52
MKRDIILSGVGGQGILSIAAVIGRAALEDGLHIKQAEVHGMSQRGGSVVTYVRYGKKVYSPIIDKGEADFVLSFELLEAARWAEYLKEGGVLLTNTQKVNPMPVITGAAEYPKALEKKLAALPIRLDAMDALGLALRAGSTRAVNLVLLGRLSRYFHFTDEQWQDAIEKSIPAKFLELNKKAFALGAEA